MIRKLIIYTIITALLVSMIGADFLSFGGDEDSSPTGLDWYQVEPWEVEFCSKWGGVDDSSVTSSGNAKYQYSSSVALRSITVQAEKESISAGDNSTNIYKVSYYVKAGTSDMNIAIRATGSGKTETILSKKKISAGQSTSGYYAWESKDNFNLVQLKHDSGVFSVPVVGEDYEYDDSCTGCSTGGSSGGWGW